MGNITQILLQIYCESNSERILKNGQQLPKLYLKLEWHVFLALCTYSYILFHLPITLSKWFSHKQIYKQCSQ